MTRAFHALIAGALALSPALAAAQDTGTRINRYPKAWQSNDIAMSEGDRARQTMLDYARCLIRSNETRVRAFATVFPDTLDYQSRAKRLSTDECIGDGILSFNTGILRASVYTALYLQDFGRSAPALSATPIDYKADTTGQDPARANQYVVLREFAECVVRAAPAESRAVVIGPIGSKAEDEAFRALAPSLGPCLPQGSSIKAGRTMLSGLLAEALYRLSAAPSQASSAGMS
ncbi:hypothetical protein [Rhizorhabdus dicambivorans]|uniref:Uncharacterized protein n=1 Tax=Rhizorhabdus dicambivorans TaxID=1850238 RepID=A0A2A4G0M6_9SPHN|nr:hypothetical protein [Rhizorhabdus dicambivorans]ATE63141.1 hypothetical protein CMV14_00955 [Rhizorhabdus dicambivorans]PCE43319.1 hypothetical protein COO09_05995 [Rhizorhabdus dicambivorans]